MEGWARRRARESSIGVCVWMGAETGGVELYRFGRVQCAQNELVGVHLESRSGGRVTWCRSEHPPAEAHEIVS